MVSLLKTEFLTFKSSVSLSSWTPHLFHMTLINLFELLISQCMVESPVYQLLGYISMVSTVLKCGWNCYHLIVVFCGIPHLLISLSSSQTLWLCGQEAGQHNGQRLPPLCWAGPWSACWRHCQLCLPGHARLLSEEMNRYLPPPGGFLPLNFEEGLGVVPRRSARRCIVRDGSEQSWEKRGEKPELLEGPMPTKRTYIAETKEWTPSSFPAKFKRWRQFWLWDQHEIWENGPKGQSTDLINLCGVGSI